MTRTALSRRPNFTSKVFSETGKPVDFRSDPKDAPTIVSGGFHNLYSGHYSFDCFPMHRRAFYEVKKESYLFPELAIRDSEREQKEEPVRQWCSFELIRAYGIPIGDLVLEHPVKVGSKKYGIDILVFKNGSPWIVVECKHRQFKDHSKAIEQAISYADAQTIRAEFAAYTNGTEWMVSRNVQGLWTPVVDLPRGERIAGNNDILDLLRTLDELLPILHVLDQTLEGENARKFLSVLQVFFHGENQITQGIDRKIRWALDNLLRVISSENRHIDYESQKLHAAYTALEQYRRETGVAIELDFDAPSRHLTFERIRSLHWFVGEMATSAGDVPGSDGLALRLMAALLAVGEDAFHPVRKLERISPPVHHALREFLGYALAVYLDLRLPDPVDHGNCGDLQMHCASAWEEFRGGF